MTQTKKNFIYNSLYQIFSIIIPIILAPFLSRRLGISGSGIYSYTYSIVYYFSLFTLLGMNNYGSRLIAKVRDNKEKISKLFWELFSLQMLFGTIMLIIYFIMIIELFKNYKTIYVIQSLFILSAMLDINWFFYGIEDFKIPILRSFIIKIINFICIIIFVKDSNDIWIYSLIMSLSAFINQLILWPFVKAKVMFIKPKFDNIKKHIKPLLVLFIPVIAVSIYKIMDKIMIGLISNISEVGLYEYAEKINSIPLTIISALGTVMLPKISNLVAKNDKKTIIQYLSKSIEFVLFISTPIIFIFIISMEYIIPLYLGVEFLPTSNLVILLSITLPFVSFANVIRTQYLIPLEKDRIYVISVIIGAFLNFIFNFLLIPFLGAKGACFGTIVAEISVMLYQTICIRKKIEIKKYLKIFALFALKSIIAFLPIFLIKHFMNINFINIIIQLIIFSTMYILLNIKYFNKNFIRINNLRRDI